MTRPDTSMHKCGAFLACDKHHALPFTLLIPYVAVMYPCMCAQATSEWYAIFFVVVIILGSFMVLQLFLAILLEQLDAVSSFCVWLSAVSLPPVLSGPDQAW